MDVLGLLANYLADYNMIQLKTFQEKILTSDMRGIISTENFISRALRSFCELFKYFVCNVQPIISIELVYCRAYWICHVVASTNGKHYIETFSCKLLVSLASNRGAYLANRFREHYYHYRSTTSDYNDFYLSPGALLARLTREEIFAMDREYKNMYKSMQWISGDIRNGVD